MHRIRTRPWLALVLALPALLLRVAIPPGFMPATASGTAFTMQMCPGHATVPLPAGGAPPGDTKHHSAPCVFAAAAGLAPVPVIATADDVDVVRVRQVDADTGAVIARPKFVAHRPRAPPSLA